MESPVRVLLIGNYARDEQQSMQRFVRVLLEQLSDRGVPVELLSPQPVWGKVGDPQTGLGKWLGYLDKFVLFPALLRRHLPTTKAGASAPLVVHICDHSNSAYTGTVGRIPHLVTCHDLLAVRSGLGEVSENPTRWSGRQLQRMILRGLNRAGRATCISEATLRDLLRLSSIKPARADVTEMGLNYPYSPMPPAEAQPLLAGLLAREQASFPPTLLPSPAGSSAARYILHVGGNQWYKNRLGVLRIYARLLALEPTAPRLLMVGKSFTEEMNRFVAKHGMQARVIAIPSCGDEELRALYSLAELLLFPSLEEGFGWPIAEAQASGCRVITTNRPPMNAVGGPAAGYFSPADIEGAAAALLGMLREEAAEKQRRIEGGLDHSKRFSTSGMIDKYIRIYGELALTN